MVESSSATLAMRRCRRGITTLSFSATSLVLPLRRLPVVDEHVFAAFVEHRFIHGVAPDQDDSSAFASSASIYSMVGSVPLSCSGSFTRCLNSEIPVVVQFELAARAGRVDFGSHSSSKPMISLMLQM